MVRFGKNVQFAAQFNKRFLTGIALSRKSNSSTKDRVAVANASPEDCNNQRPHSALGNLTPKEFAKKPMMD